MTPEAPVVLIGTSLAEASHQVVRNGLRIARAAEVYHFAVAVAAFGLGAVMAVMQGLSRAGFAVPFRNESMYYISMTAHGVLMAIVFTTFFIMGLGLPAAPPGARPPGARAAGMGLLV